jgi:hypothetical protein
MVQHRTNLVLHQTYLEELQAEEQKWIQMDCSAQNYPLEAAVVVEQPVEEQALHLVHFDH